MDSWSQYPDRVRVWWNELSPRNRGYALGTAVLFLSVIGITLSMHSQPRLVPLSLGKQLTPEELQRVEMSLRSNNLSDYQRSGNQILVPEERQTAYDAALIETRSLPGDWASDWEQKFESTNPFTSSRKLQMLKDIALAKELKRIIQGLDGVQEASVVWTDSDQHGWTGRKTGVTATVNIRSEPDRNLSERTIRGIQFSVANMVAHLAPESVLVFDAATGRHYQMQPEEARFESAFDNWLELERRNWFSQIESALQTNWPGAELLLSVDEMGLRQHLRHPVRTHNAESTANGSLHLQTKQTVTSDEPLEFSQMKPRLQAEFPRSLTLTVRLPHELAPQQPEIAVALQSIADGANIRFEVLKSSDALVQSNISADHPFAGNAPAILVVALGLLLSAIVWSVAAKRSDKKLPSTEALPDSSASTASQPSPTPPSLETPLGDPETVASVLQNWLRSSSQPATDELAKDPHRG
ncbi:MAG TPA: hypothetical protein VMM56_04565 [Planctomycetaceae bacterium]|nr:hypothetical protein [Planctomycetaceae bacterium]